VGRSVGSTRRSPLTRRNVSGTGLSLVLLTLWSGRHELYYNRFEVNHWVILHCEM
jgi:hypothetical protein